ncbi:glycoside hydrolase family 53 protein [Bacillus sp. BR_10]|uniref:glycoside hydrolase family 53 protein n=1 Tax=Bacillus TaxID=1386 RepID=UPI0035C003E9
MKKWLLVTVVVFFLMGLGILPEAKADTISVKPINGLQGDFIKGADISMLAEVERSGGKYYNQNWQQVDPLKLLKDKGVNYVRIRLWNHPYDNQGRAYNGGTNDLNTAIALSKRAKAQNMKVLLDFHYSDFWTDPGKQFKPKAWTNLSQSDLEKAVGTYTSDVLKAMKAQNALPNMVQVGNELNSGMLWPNGKSWGEGGGEFDRLAALLKAGTNAVRSVDSNIKIMLHLAHGGDNGASRWWFDEITKRGVSFDTIGLSYYPYWDGGFSGLTTNMNDISARYNKDVIVVETAYGFTTANGDNLDNSFNQDSVNTAGYPASPQGQASFIRDLSEKISQVKNNRGKGFFYWEPLWIPAKGAPWSSQYGLAYIQTTGTVGNAWENQAMFDFNGKALPSLDVFKQMTP